MLKIKWIIYTVIIGLIPIIIKLFIAVVSNNVTYEYCLNTNDFLTFSLVLNLTNINEIDGDNLIDANWKVSRIGVSIIMIVIIAAILGVINYAEVQNKNDININAIRLCCGLFAIGSFLFSYSIYNKLNHLRP